jgi:hypothetical protein
MTEQDEDYPRRRRPPHESIIMGAAPPTCSDEAAQTHEAYAARSNVVADYIERSGR